MSYTLFHDAADQERRRICEHGKVAPIRDYEAEQHEATTKFCQAFWSVVGVGIVLYCIGAAYALHRLGWW